MGPKVGRRSWRKRFWTKWEPRDSTSSYGACSAASLSLCLLLKYEIHLDSAWGCFRFKTEATLHVFTNKRCNDTAVKMSLLLLQRPLGRAFLMYQLHDQGESRLDQVMWDINPAVSVGGSSWCSFPLTDRKSSLFRALRFSFPCWYL